MKKIISIAILAASLAFAAEATTAQSEVKNEVIIKPTKEQLSKAKALNNTICPVSKDKIGTMGMAIPVIYKGKVINLCCAGCPAEFAKDPEKFLKIAQDEVAKKSK